MVFLHRGSTDFRGEVAIMEFTGERYISNIDSPEISYEHWHRYLFATQFVKDKVVLDIACGEGYGSYLLSKYAEKVVGVDVSQETVNYASNKYINGNLEFKVGSAGSIPIDGEGCFDVVVSFETIEHITEEDQKAFLKEVRRLLKPDGYFVVSTPNKLTYSDIPNYRNEFHLKEFYISEYNEFLGAYFKNIRLMGQRIYPISYIWNNDDVETRFTEYRLEYSENGFNPSDMTKQMLYAIAVCSDSDFKDVPASIMLDLSDRVIKVRDSHLERAQDVMKEKDALIDHLNSLITRNEAYAKSLETAIIGRDTHIDSLQNQFKDLEAVLRDRDIELDHIYCSSGWKALLFYYKLRDKLFGLSRKAANKEQGI